MDVTIRLAEVDENNWMDVILLTTQEDGIPVVCEQYVASNALSICQAVFEDFWEYKAIYCGKKAIGFAMYGFNDKSGCYEICRLMIDRNHQGKGFGNIALRLIIEDMFNSYVDCDEIYLAVHEENERGKHLYQKNGFVATGQKNGHEEIYCLYLES